MKVRVYGPCDIESDKPFTIIPVYTPKVEDFAESIPDKAVKPTKGYPKTRKSPKNSDLTCVYCGRSYRGYALRKFCGDACKRSWKQNGQKPMDAGKARIHVGAE